MFAMFSIQFRGISTLTLLHYSPHPPSPEVLHLPKLKLCAHETLTHHPPPASPITTIPFLSLNLTTLGTHVILWILKGIHYSCCSNHFSSGNCCILTGLQLRQTIICIPGIHFRPYASLLLTFPLPRSTFTFLEGITPGNTPSGKLPLTSCTSN